MIYEDLCKKLAIKQAQQKKDSETKVALDCIKTGKNHKSYLRKKVRKLTIIIA